MSNNILSKAGDFLPVWKTEFREDGTQKINRHKPYHKDGESPGEEWTKNEVTVIRALANPVYGTPEKAAKVSKISIKVIKRWLRNPYFQNEIFKLTSSFLQQARVKVLKTVIDQATTGSYQDRQLFFRLIGELKDEKKIDVSRKSVTHYADQTEQEIDDWVQDDINSLNEFRRRNGRKRRG